MGAAEALRAGAIAAAVVGDFYGQGLDLAKYGCTHCQQIGRRAPVSRACDGCPFPRRS